MSPDGSGGGVADPLAGIWPPFGLVIRTPRLVLTPVRDAHLPELVDAVLAGIHDPAEMPFSVPWTDAPRDVLILETAKHQWRTRAQVSVESWTLNFVVLHEGRVVGIQDLVARSFPLLRRVGSGSWLTRQAQGCGIGTEMRSAVLQFAFDRLGATSAVSEAASWNRASLGVSRRLGYRDNGTTLVEARRGEVELQQNLLLDREDFVRPPWTAEVEGLEPVLAQLIPGRQS
ncbi:Putative succinyl-CoA transferase Rv0802c [Arthrobacter agilis]|uniref:GNAT family N-acetyltransferase n=1 Tax=Arthrobacter agilis TaxID=37921 RepID=UPI000F6F148A|nr:GNAT family N-acetyltransferase [Arthrobacter agilis]VDR32588.1 Putative succinyl-CoA transferase Rv0802c [Arthrobacter agilis]